MSMLPSASAPMATRVCRTCKWFKTDPSYHSATFRIKEGFCTHPNYRVVDRVAGDVEFPKATTIRKLTHASDPTVCGLDGVLWESETAYRMFIRELKSPTPVDVFIYVVCIFVALGAFVIMAEQ